MKIIRADVLGMCFGVRDALRIIQDVNEPETVTIHGELVHNQMVLEQLHERGFQMVAEKQRTQRRELPVTETVLITAHGVSNIERQRLESAGKKLIDTTCPLVVRATMRPETPTRRLSCAGHRTGRTRGSPRDCRGFAQLRHHSKSGGSEALSYPSARHYVPDDNAGPTGRSRACRCRPAQSRCRDPLHRYRMPSDQGSSKGPGTLA